MLGSVRADKGFGTDEMLALGRAMRGFTPSSSEFASVPIGQMGYAVKGIGSTVKWDEREVEAALPGAARGQAARRRAAGRRGRRPSRGRGGPAADPGAGRERHRAPTGSAGGSTRALRGHRLRTTRAPANGRATATVRRTVVAYDPRWDRSAKSLAAALPGQRAAGGDGAGPDAEGDRGRGLQQVTRVRAEDPHQGEFGVVTGDQVVCPLTTRDA